MLLIQHCHVSVNLDFPSAAIQPAHAFPFPAFMRLIPCLDQGQGAAQGFEDAAVLGTLLDESCDIANLAERLHMYEKIRYPRAITVMYMSMVHEEKRAEQLEVLRSFVPGAELPKDMFRYTWMSDPIGQARAELNANS